MASAHEVSEFATILIRDQLFDYDQFNELQLERHFTIIAYTEDELKNTYPGIHTSVKQRVYREIKTYLHKCINVENLKRSINTTEDISRLQDYLKIRSDSSKGSIKRIIEPNTKPENDIHRILLKDAMSDIDLIITIYQHNSEIVQKKLNLYEEELKAASQVDNPRHSTMNSGAQEENGIGQNPPEIPHIIKAYFHNHPNVSPMKKSFVNNWDTIKELIMQHLSTQLELNEGDLDDHDTAIEILQNLEIDIRNNERFIVKDLH